MQIQALKIAILLKMSSLFWMQNASIKALVILISKKDFHFQYGCIKNVTRRCSSFKFCLYHMWLQHEASLATLGLMLSWSFTEMSAFILFTSICTCLVVEDHIFLSHYIHFAIELL